MSKHPHCPSALTIAGSDSGGGAGIQADLRTFSAFGVHGLTAITCLTAQNPDRVCNIEAVKASMVRAQMESVLEAFQPQCCKVGMVYSAGIVRTVARVLRKWGRMRLVIDPVLVSSSGAPLLQRAALRAFQNELLPLATLITPNVPEAETLSGLSIREPEDMRSAARALFDRTGCAILLKGGHGRDRKSSIDLFFDGRDEFLFTLPRLKGSGVHGTGCALSAAITAGIARGDSLLDAIRAAKEFTTAAMADYHRVKSHRVLAFESPGVRR